MWMGKDWGWDKTWKHENESKMGQMKKYRTKESLHNEESN